MPGPGTQLLLLAIALYLQDALLLLRPDQGVLECSQRGSWRLGLSSDSLRVGRRQLYIPNLLLIHRPLFRGCWLSASADPASDSVVTRWNAAASIYTALSPFVLGCAGVFFGILPLAFWWGASDGVLFGLLGLGYGLILVIVGLLVQRRVTFGLTLPQALTLAAECLLCPPVAVNLIRRLSLARQFPDDFLQVIEVLLPPPAWAQARQALQQRVQMLQDENGTDSDDGKRASVVLARIGREENP